VKMRVLVVADVDVPDALLTGGATPEAVAAIAKQTCEKRVSRIWEGWGNKVEATVSMIPDGSPMPEVGQ
jgi:hypothetical protein